MERIINNKQQLINTIERDAPNATLGLGPEVLTTILQENINISIWKRDIAELESELQSISNSDVEFRSSGDISSIENHLRSDLSQYALNLVIEDLLNQLDLFARVTQAKEFKFLFATISTNMCRRFHSDLNSLRMLCTYVGASTQWLSDDITNSQLFQRQIKSDEIKIDQNLINETGTGNTVILKGALFPNGNAIIHRSPPIEKTGHKRLLLRIDINQSIWT